MLIKVRRESELRSSANATTILGNRTSNFYKYQCVESWNLEKKEEQKNIHLNADSSNVELLFRITHSANQLSVYGAVSSWSGQHSPGTRKRRRQ